MSWNFGGGSDNGETSDTSVNTSPSSILGTTWFWNKTDSSTETCSHTHYSGSSGSGSDSGSGSSSNTCSNYTRYTEEISRTTVTVDASTNTLKGYYLHIESNGTSYLGTYSYTETISAYTYDKVTYKVTYTCNDEMHDLSGWTSNETEYENSTRSAPVYGEKTNFTPIYKGSVSTSGTKAKFNFIYKYNEIENNSDSSYYGDDSSYYYTSSSSSIEESYWAGAESIGIPATTTSLYYSSTTSSSSSSQAYDLSVEKTSSYLNLIYASGTTSCKQKIDALGTLCSNSLGYKNWGHWDVGTYNEAMIGPADQREALYKVLKDTSWSGNLDETLTVGKSTGNTITFSDNLNYTVDSLVYWGGNYYQLLQTETSVSWSASPKGHLVLGSNFYDILYKTSSSSDSEKYQLYFKGKLYPSSSDSVIAQGIGSWDSVFLSQKAPTDKVLKTDEYGYYYEDTVSVDSDVHVSASESSNFTYSYKPFSGTTFSSIYLYSDASKFKYNTYANKKDFVSGKEWYVQAAIWSDSDGTKFECTGLSASTSIQKYSLTYDDTTYTLSDVGDLTSNKYILLAYDSSSSLRTYKSFILEDKKDGTLTLVPVDEESDFTKVKTLKYESRYGYDANNYVAVTLGAEDNLLSKNVADIVKTVYSDYDYTISDSSVSVNLLKTAKVSDVVSAFNSYTNLKIAQSLVVKVGSSEEKISDTSVTLENNNNIYFATEIDSTAFYATYQIASSGETFTEPSDSEDDTYINYKYELSEDKKSLKVLVLPETYIYSCIESFIKDLNSDISYSYPSGTETKTASPYSSFSELSISSDITFTVSFETYKYSEDDSEDYTYYNVYYNDSLIIEITLSTFSEIGLTEGTDYTVDESSNTITLTASGYSKLQSL